MGYLQGGTYLIRNAGSASHHLTLYGQDQQIKGARKDGSTKQKWSVNDLGNKTYQVTNIAFGTQNAYATVGAGNSVMGDTALFEWTITELNPGTYRIASSNLAWSLENDVVKLARFDTQNDDQIFYFDSVA